MDRAPQGVSHRPAADQPSKEDRHATTNASPTAASFPASVLALQRSAGNAATAALLRGSAPARTLQRFTWERMSDRFRAADVEELIDESLAEGGHAGEQHIYIGMAGLMAREISEASAFYDEEHAHRVIAEIVNANKQEIAEHVATNPHKSERFTFREKYPDVKIWGYGTAKGGKGATFGSVGADVVVVIDYRYVAPNHIVILRTAYPVQVHASEVAEGKRAIREQRQESRKQRKQAEKEYEKYLKSLGIK